MRKGLDCRLVRNHTAAGATPLPHACRAWESTATFVTSDPAVFLFNVASRPQRPYGPLGTGSPGRPPRLSRRSCPQFFSFFFSFTSTETIQTIRDGEPRTSTATFTQILPPVLQCFFLYVHRDHTDHLGRGAQGVHRDFHTAPEL